MPIGDECNVVVFVRGIGRTHKETVGCDIRAKNIVHIQNIGKGTGRRPLGLKSHKYRHFRAGLDIIPKGAKREVAPSGGADMRNPV